MRDWDGIPPLLRASLPNGKQLVFVIGSVYAQAISVNGHVRLCHYSMHILFGLCRSTPTTRHKSSDAAGFLERASGQKPSMNAITYLVPSTSLIDEVKVWITLENALICLGMSTRPSFCQRLSRSEFRHPPFFRCTLTLVAISGSNPDPSLK
jgi:hypothetical protein